MAAVSQLDTAHLLPTGNGLLRLKTDVKVGGPETEYSVSIKDSQGLSSAVISAKTKKNKLADVELLDDATPIGATPSSEGATDGNPKVFAGMSGKTLTAQAAPAGAVITGSIAKHNSDGTWTEISGGTVNGTTPVTITLPALGTGEDEALYKISLKAQLSGYDDSDSKDFFVKLVRQEVPVLKLKQDFNQTSDVTLHSISAGTEGYVKEDIIPYAGNYDNPAKALVIYNMVNGQCKLDLSASAGATVKYRLDSTSSTPMPTAIITVPIGAHTLEVWAVKDGIEGPKTTVYIKVVNFVGSYDELKNIVKNAPKKGLEYGQYDYNNFINIKIGSASALIADSEIAVTGGKKLMLSSSVASTVRTINANNSRHIFKISGAGTMLTLWDIQLTGGNAADGKGGAVCVETGGDLWLKGKTVITPSTAPDINTPGKNDVYLVSGASINVKGVLAAVEPIVARITVADSQYSISTQVLTASAGVTLAEETYKFAVTPKIVGGTPQPWTVGGNGYLKPGRYTEVPYDKLEAYLANASSTKVNYIEITGDIPAAVLKGSFVSNSANPGVLGQNIKNIYPKKVALKLPSSLSVTDMSYCFASCKNLISVENIPSSVTNMEGCFYQCLNLTQAPVIPANVTNMEGCFYDCRSLTTVPNIPATVTNMRYCFASCIALTTVPNIPSGVTNMAFCFEGCTSLTTVPNIPATVTSMAYCFDRCTGLTTAPVIPSSVTDMRYCFRNCTSLTQGPDIPATVTHMRECFKGCTGLQRVKLNCNYNSGNFNGAFSNCTALEDGGIKVPLLQFAIYKANAAHMGTTKEKFSAIIP